LVIRHGKHPTELARGRLENHRSEPIIQRATAILQVALANPKPEHLTPLININRELAAGLRGSP
jgi:hypothetical protein